jgi:ubiquitin carboxyl-terminal hydrolase 36/42
MKEKVLKNRGDADKEEDKGVKLTAPLIGPLLPSAEITGNGTTTTPPSSPIDPQAMSLKSKIQAVAQTQARKALENLGNYDSEDDNKLIRDGDKDDRMAVNANGKENGKGKEYDGSDVPTRPSSPPTAPPTSPLRHIPAAQFYSNSGKNKKRKFSEAKALTPLSARTNGYHQTTNPFSRPIPKRKRMGI